MKKLGILAGLAVAVCAVTAEALLPPLGVGGPMTGTWTLKGKQIEYDATGGKDKQKIASQMVLSDDSNGASSTLTGTFDGLAVTGIRYGTGFVVTGSDGAGDQLVVSGQIKLKGGLAKKLAGEFTHYDGDDVTRARIKGKRAD